MANAPAPSWTCPKCGFLMARGSVGLMAKSGVRGAKIGWLDLSAGVSTLTLDEAQDSETLVNYGALDVLAHQGKDAFGLRFEGWRCKKCRIVSFSYPQGTRRW